MKIKCLSTLLEAVCRPWNGRFSYSPGSVNGSAIEDDFSCTAKPKQHIYTITYIYIFMYICDWFGRLSDCCMLFDYVCGIAKW